MKITCTEFQKRVIIKLFADAYRCPIPENKCKSSCVDCCKENIEWEIEEEADENHA